MGNLVKSVIEFPAVDADAYLTQKLLFGFILRKACFFARSLVTG